MNKLMLKVINLKVKINNKLILNNLNFNVKYGEFLSIIGENGVGKTTLIKVILGNLAPVSGRVKYLPNRQAVKIGYVPQYRNFDANYPLSINSFITLNSGTWYHPWLWKKDRQRLHKLLTMTHLTHLVNNRLVSASGGEKQRAYIAQALFSQPNLLILDESTASLDPKAKIEVLEMLETLNKQIGITIIFVTHDLELAKKFSDTFLWLGKDKYTIGSSENINVKKFEEGNEG